MKRNIYDAEIRIPSDLIYLRSVRAFIRELAKNLGLCQERVNDIELATDEILSNAIEHGSEGLHSKIFLRLKVTDETIKITISDTGNQSNLKDNWTSAWSDVIKKKIQYGTERGHGLFLTYNLTDKMFMEYNSSGGLDVHLIWDIRRKSEYNKANIVCYNPQVSESSKKNQKVYESSKL